MKKLLYLIITVLCVESGLQAYHRHYPRRQPARRSAVNCKQCCADGRFASAECMRYCNYCQQYDDSGAAEGRDFPN